VFRFQPFPRRETDVKKPVDNRPAGGLLFARAHSRHHPRAGGADPDRVVGRGVSPGLAGAAGAGYANQAQRGLAFAGRNAGPPYRQAQPPTLNHQ
jgi:hypothetical protein